MLTLVLLTAALASGREYFVSPTGLDSADGRSPETALQSFAVAGRLRPGDVLRLQRGGVWHQTLRLTQSGLPGQPIRITAYGKGELPTIDGAASNTAKPLDLCIDASTSFIDIDSLRVTHAAGAQRGAIMVWGHHDLAGISIQNCQIDANAGRGIWIAGETGRSVGWVLIRGNIIRDNAGCGVLATKLNVGWVMANEITGNCGKTIDSWQAGVRVWSTGVRALTVADNHIDNGLHGLERGAGMGVHIDETGDSVVVTGNDIAHCDAGGVEIENTRGVAVANNMIFDTHTGIVVYRAGHEHVISHNTIVARSQGIVLQGMLAHGVDAGPEIVVDGNLLTGNVIAKNIAIARQWGSLKLIGGGERLDGPMANIVTGNALGPERPGLIEFGGQTIGRYADTAARHIDASIDGAPPFTNLADGDISCPTGWADCGASRHSAAP